MIQINSCTSLVPTITDVTLGLDRDPVNWRTVGEFELDAWTEVDLEIPDLDAGTVDIVAEVGLLPLEFKWLESTDGAEFEWFVWPATCDNCWVNSTLDAWTNLSNSESVTVIGPPKKQIKFSRAKIKYDNYKF